EFYRLVVGEYFFVERTVFLSCDPSHQVWEEVIGKQNWRCVTTGHGQGQNFPDISPPPPPFRYNSTRDPPNLVTRLQGFSLRLRKDCNSQGPPGHLAAPVQLCRRRALSRSAEVQEPVPGLPASRQRPRAWAKVRQRKPAARRILGDGGRGGDLRRRKPAAGVRAVSGAVRGSAPMEPLSPVRGPLQDSSWYEPSAELVQTRMAVSLTAAETLALQGTQGQEKIMMMEPKEEEQSCEYETRLAGNHSTSQEIFRQRFRHLRYQETPGPREALSQLRVLCCEWLRPEKHTKEQILEFLVLEQFLTILPEELQSWVRGHHPKSGEEAVTVLEDLEKGLEPEPQVPGPAHGPAQEEPWEKTESLGAAQEALSIQLQPKETQPFPKSGEEQDSVGRERRKRDYKGHST
ncbi:zinc finger and SCAN domain-containing protein 21-like, partial [Hylobates moloch]|uniref:zinc finger and SCAN domain-containing protein 21-like n=1 Tax=Hylobates moloch TaxID=81572 RepID=UPI0026763212